MEWYPKDVAAYRLDTRHLTTVQHGAYNLLIDEYYATRQPLPDNDLALASIAKLPLAEWEVMAATVRAFFKRRSAKLHLKRADEVLDAQDKKAKRRSVKAEKAARVRHNKNKKLATPSTAQAGASNSGAEASGAQGCEREIESKTEKENQEDTAQPTRLVSVKPVEPAALRGGMDSRFEEVQRRCVVILGSPPGVAWGRISAWLSDGADPERDIYPTLEARRARWGSSNLEYFDKAIRSAMESGVKPMPTADAKARAPGEYTAGAKPVSPEERLDILTRWAGRLTAGEPRPKFISDREIDEMVARGLLTPETAKACAA